jgi:opacity protein-like surface antigen
MQIFASSFKYYAKIDAVYDFKNVCPSIITVTAATSTTAEVATVGAALVPPPTISKSYSFAGALGLEWDLGYRTEIALNHLPRIDYSYQQDKQSDLTQFKYGLTSVMANLILQLPADRFLIPFCNIGVGYARHYLYDFETYDKDMKPKIKINSGERWAFAWQIGAGVSIRLNQNLDIDIGYRHICFDRIDSGLEETDVSATPSVPATKALASAKTYGIPKSHQIFMAARIYF